MNKNPGVSMDETPNLSRRDFLILSIKILVGAGGLLSLGGLVRFLDYKGDPASPSEYNLGEPSLYPLGSHTVRPDIPAAIDNRTGEITATSLTCTHLGCTLEDDGLSYTCPCHGSHFDRDGRVLKGPAKARLRSLRVEMQEDKTLVLYPNKGQK